MKPIKRIAIDDHLAAAAAPGELPGLAGPVRALAALRGLAVALDQVVNRSQDDLRRYGEIDKGTARHNEDDFAACRTLLRTLELGLAAGRGMLAAVEAQVTPPPAPAPVPAPVPAPPAEPEPAPSPAPEPSAPKDRRGK